MSSMQWLHRQWRRKAERFARHHRFYWAPCVLCGEPHGGQENTGCIATDDPHAFTQICSACTAERQHAAEQRLAELGESVVAGGGTSSSGRHSPIHRIPFDPRREREMAVWPGI